MDLLKGLATRYHLDQEYKRFISSKASIILSKKTVFALILIFAVLSYTDYSLIHSTQWKHLPASILLGAGYFIFHNFHGKLWSKIAPYWIDAIVFSEVVASIHLTLVCYRIDFPLNSAPIQITLLIGGIVGYHSSLIIILRNIVFGCVAAAALFAFGGLQLLMHDIAQIIIGAGVGSFVYVSLFEPKLRGEFVQSLIASKASHRLHDVLTSTLYPHQVKMIKEGFTIDETMPGYKKDAVLLKMDVIGSSKVRDKKAFEMAMKGFCSAIEEELIGSINLTTRSPCILMGKGYFVKDVGDAAIFTIGNPVLLPRNLSMEEAIDQLLERILHTFEEQVRKKLPEEKLNFCIGMVYDDLQGSFSGKRKNYDLFGAAQLLGERYETLRKQIGEAFDLPSGQDFVLMQDRVWSIYSRSSVVDFKKISLGNFKVRDDERANHVWLLTYKKSAKITIMPMVS